MLENISFKKRNERDRDIKICYSSLCINSTKKTSKIIYLTEVYLSESERGKYSTFTDDQDHVKIKTLL